MKSLIKAALASAVVCLWCTALLAQQTTSTDSVTALRTTPPMRSSEHWPLVVTGEPYSAVTKVENVKVANDGTRFESHTVRQKTYRDSLGRTRTEHYIGMNISGGNSNPTLVSIWIRDPAAGVSYFLDPRTHTAKESHSARVSPADLGPVAQTFTQSKSAPTSQSQEERELYQPKVTREDLGTQEMEGQTVSGTRITMAFPAGAQGSDRPFEIVTERWASEELKTFILVKNSDPRNGENTIRTTDIDRTEPDPSLFEVPADYTITEQ